MIRAALGLIVVIALMCWGIWSLAVMATKSECEALQKHSPYIYVWDSPNCIYGGVK